MSIIGKLHEIALYGLISNIICYLSGKVTYDSLIKCAFHVTNFLEAFICYLFWSTVLYIPIAIIGAYSTKYKDEGRGSTFFSDNIIVILFAHIAEDILGLFLTVFWFLKDLFTHDFFFGKVLDYILYLIEIVFIGLGFYMLFK